ncbi:FAD-dependent oxidoreductase [uncultured Sulfitobacter sp.]|uniref:flavin monoamine oxidase family protein n=1 Tax=uncultured Sulfitobacter sp. TaxID=191468 RepID=UPI00260EA7EF|nr:FAD-dependent oxidoreductase [uncultured Sulfitobacter sp.]
MSDAGPMQTDVAIVGGGLSGLALADMLHRAGVGFELFEARGRFGGRIDTLRHGAGGVDLGPSWFWPGQARMARLIEDLDQRAFAQYATGDLCFEDQRGEVQRGVGFASMEGALRVAGGLSALIDGLVARLPRAQLHESHPVSRIERGALVLENGSTCTARHTVVTVPPRLAANLVYDPPLPGPALQSLRQIPTWMAGHAKFVAVYDRPFWRAAGLSGDATSRRGPMVEIHDASGPEGTPAALFGFLGIPAAQRNGQAAQIEAAAIDQLGRLFGTDALHPRATAFKDWAQDPATATAQDHTPPHGHPAYGPLAMLDGLREGHLHFASTETAPDMGGLMEGALAGAERVAARILAA